MTGGELAYAQGRPPQNRCVVDPRKSPGENVNSNSRCRTQTSVIAGDAEREGKGALLEGGGTTGDEIKGGTL